MNRHPGRWTAALALLGALAASGCEPDLIAQLPDAAVDAAVIPDACVPTGSHIVYLNGTPTTYRPGPADSVANTTDIVTEEVTTLGPYTMSATSWRLFRECVVAGLSPFDVTVTDQDPGDVDHLEIAVSNRSSEIGKPDGWAGIAAGGCPGGPRLISFAFWAPHVPDERALCELVLWAVGIDAGLSNSTECRDLMGPPSLDAGCRPRSYLDEIVPCAHPVTGAPADCTCGGVAQNSYISMTGFWGVNRCAP